MYPYNEIIDSNKIHTVFIWLSCACHTFYTFFLRRDLLSQCIFNFFSGFLVLLNPLLSFVSHWYLYILACLPPFNSCLRPPLHHSSVSPVISKAICTFTFFLTCHRNIRLQAAAGSLFLSLIKGHPLFTGNMCIWDLGPLAGLGTVREIFDTVQCVSTASAKSSKVSARIHTK